MLPVQRPDPPARRGYPPPGTFLRKRIAFICSRSTRPVNLSSLPMGAVWGPHWLEHILAWVRTLSNCVFRSILLTKEYEQISFSASFRPALCPPQPGYGAQVDEGGFNHPEDDYFADKVEVARCINQVQLAVLPLNRRHGRVDGNLPLISSASKSVVVVPSSTCHALNGPGRIQHALRQCLSRSAMTMMLILRNFSVE